MHCDVDRMWYRRFRKTTGTNENPTASEENNDLEDRLTMGNENYKGFQMDNVFHSDSLGEIHYHIHVPDSYDGSEPYALYVTLPGYEGLYFQGVGENLKSENFAFEAQKYNDKMIIAAPQLDDWGEMSANKTVELVRFLMEYYNVDSSKIYANGYSSGGETMSLVLEKAPELFTAYLHCSSKWEGDFSGVIKNQLPVYFVVGENDEYYGMVVFTEKVGGKFFIKQDLKLVENITFASCFIKTVIN